MLRLLPALAAALLGVGCGERAEPIGDLGVDYPVTVRGAGRPADHRRDAAAGGSSRSLLTELRSCSSSASAAGSSGFQPASKASPAEAFQVATLTGQVDVSDVRPAQARPPRRHPDHRLRRRGAREPADRRRALRAARRLGGRHRARDRRARVPRRGTGRGAAPRRRSSSSESPPSSGESRAGRRRPCSSTPASSSPSRPARSSAT